MLENNVNAPLLLTAYRVGLRVGIIIIIIIIIIIVTVCVRRARVHPGGLVRGVRGGATCVYEVNLTKKSTGREKCRIREYRSRVLIDDRPSPFLFPLECVLA